MAIRGMYHFNADIALDKWLTSIYCARTMIQTIAEFVMLAVSLTATSHQNAPFRIDPRTDFSKFKTYAWGRSKNTDRVTNQADAQVRDALEAELARKGLTKTDSDAAQLLICYHSNFGTEQIRRHHIRRRSFIRVDYETAQVAVDMIDSSTKKLSWHNTADLNPKAKPQHIEKAVSNLLRNYPPKKK